VTVDTGGAVTAPTIDIGSNSFGNGFVTITGAGSTITSTNTFLVW
jgi:T5SS/PEP-CTERM-associated repeat protein